MDIKSIEQLTPYEFKVLKLIVEGKKNRDIADGLNVSLSTVNTHVQRIMDKIDIHDRKLLIVEYYTFFRQKK